MTTKDYVLLAKGISQMSDARMRSMAIAALIPVLEKDNERFDESKFRKACHGRD